MTNLKPFDLEAARAGSPVCTRDGRKARIVCFDKKGSEYGCICALIQDRTGTEDMFFYGKTGYFTPCQDTELDLFMAAPEIPEGFTPYDPNVPPPDMSDTVQLFYKDNTLGYEFVEYNLLIWNELSNIVAWRVTKWRLPEGVHQHFGGERPEEATGRGTVWFIDGRKAKGDLWKGGYEEGGIFYPGFWGWEIGDGWGDMVKIIGWQRDDEAKKDALEEAITNLTIDICATDVFAQKLRAFAKAIIEEARKK